MMRFATQTILFRSAFLVVVWILVAGHVGKAQSTTVSPERGFNPGNSYAMSNIETISQNSGNVMLNVPLGSLPSGRGRSGGGLSINYNSKIWDAELPEPVAPAFTEFQNLKPSMEGGWKYSYQKYDLKSEYIQVSTGGCYHKLYLVTPDGGKHLLWLNGYMLSDGSLNGIYPDGTFDCTTPPTFSTQPNNLTFFTLDGTYMRVLIEGDNDATAANNRWTVYLPDGSIVIHNPDHIADPEHGHLQEIIDRNGNSIDITENASDSAYSNHRTTVLTDDLGRSVAIEYEHDHTNHPNEDAIHSKGFNGTDLVTMVQWKAITVNRTYEYCASNCLGGHLTTDISQNFRVVDKIYLPEPVNDLFYEFDYNADATSNPSTGWGEISKVTLPSGAYSTYSYLRDNSSNTLAYDKILEDRPVQKTLTYLNEYDGSSSSETQTWTYAGLCDVLKGDPSCSITAPDGSVSTEYYNGWNGNTNATGSYYNESFYKPYKSVSGTGVVVERVYANNIPADSSVVASANQFVKYEMTSIPNASGTLTKTAIKEFSQDKNGNTTEIKDYDFVPYSGTGSVPRDSNGRPTGLPSGATQVRITKTEYYNDTPDSASTTYTDADSYIYATSSPLRALPKTIEVQDSSGTPVSRSEMTYDYTDYSSSNTIAGNLTQTKAWDSYKGGSSRAYSDPLTSTNSITTSATYNSYGMPLTATDANGNVTQITYGNVAGPSGTVTDLYPTQTVTAYGTGQARTTTATYDFYTGAVLTTTDADNGVTNATVYDDLGRPVKAITAQGTALESWTTTEYHDADRYVVVKSDLEAKDDRKKVATQFYDQLGRVRLSKTLEDASTQSATNETDGIKVQTRYLTDYNSGTGVGHTYQLSSNPFRAATSSAASNEPTMGWTLSTALNTGRHSEVQSFAGAGLPAVFGGSNTSSTGVVTTDSDADRTLVTDQAGKQRISRSNALGQLTDVWEVTPSDGSTVAVTFPGTSIATGYQTSYVYDPLNNLTTVSQGSQTRSFTYNTLSRLLTAANPESGTISYAYDPNGNLTSKTDARSITTTYAYDALNRVISRSYSDSTPAVGYTYDDKTNAKGKLTKVSSSVSTTEYTSFDILGRVTASKQTTDGGDTSGYTTGYTYNLSGALETETYPSTRVVKNTLNNDGTLSMVQSQKNSNYGYWAYANSFTYNSAGAVTSMQLGNGRWESTVFNSRLQPTQIALGTTNTGTLAYDQLKLNYDYGTTANNGNVQSQTITVTRSNQSPLVFSQSYVYDSLNRLKSAEEITGSTSNWKQTYTFDRYGNRNFDEANTTTLTKHCGTSPNFTICTSDVPKENPAISTSNNRLTTGYTFDAAGNVTVDAEGRIFTYDAENKQTEAKNSSNTSLGTYYFDGDGKRVKKVVPSTGETTIFVYDASGKMVAEYSTNVVSVQDAKVQYLTYDNLGTPRINADQNGAVTARHDYMPYGEEIISLGGRSSTDKYVADDVRQGFTGYINDEETGLDFAEARMYFKTLGRFSGADPTLNSGRPDMPQSWNKYSYSVNSPIKFNDQTGLFEWDSTLQEDASLGEKENKRRAKLREKILAGYDKARAEIDKAMNSKKLSADKLAKLNNALNALGPKPGQAGSNNGVTVGIGVSSKNPNALGETTPTFIYEQDMDGSHGGNSLTATISVKFTENFANSNGIFAGLVHEGSHVNDIQMLEANPAGIMSGQSPLDLTQYQTEYNAFQANSYLFEAMGGNGSNYGIPVWNNAWTKVDKKLPPLETSRDTAINGTISGAYFDGYGNPITSNNQGSKFSAYGISVRPKR